MTLQANPGSLSFWCLQLRSMAALLPSCNASAMSRLLQPHCSLSFPRSALSVLLQRTSLQLQPVPSLLQGAAGALPDSVKHSFAAHVHRDVCCPGCRQRLGAPEPQPRQFQADMRRLWSGPPPLPASPRCWTGITVHPFMPCDPARPLDPRGHPRAQLPWVSMVLCFTSVLFDPPGKHRCTVH